MAYKRMTKVERKLIYMWCQEGLGPRRISRRLKRPTSSISREIRRNSGQRGYRPKQAHAMAQWRTSFRLAPFYAGGDGRRGKSTPRRLDA